MTALFTAVLAALGGLLGVTLGPTFLKMVIEPVREFKQTMSKIAHDLIEYANVYTNPKPLDDEKQSHISKQMRSSSAALRSGMFAIPAYDHTRLLFGLPKRKDVDNAASELIGLSNGWDGPLANQGLLNHYRAQRIRDALGIPVPQGERLDLKHEHALIKAKSI